jgi:pilus assembly protein CpaE
MRENNTIIIIDPDANARQTIKKELEHLQVIQVVGESGELTEGFELIKQHVPDIVLLDISQATDFSLGFAEKITQNFTSTALFICTSQSTPELIRKSMHAGARDFLIKPINRDEFFSAIQTVIRHKRQRLAAEGMGGKVFSVFGVKGGVGTTTVATNLAVSLKRHSNRSVVLVDLNLQLGNAALFLNVVPKYSIIDIINNINSILPHSLKDYLPKDVTGVSILAGPNRPEEAEIITAAHLDQILGILRAEFDYIILDTNVILDDFTLKALDESNNIITVLEYDILSVYNARRCLDIFKRMGYPENKVLIVMNRFDEGSGLAYQEFKKTINYPIFWKIPNQDYSNVWKSINKGVPLALLLPRSKVGQSFFKLATHLNGGISKNKNNPKPVKHVSYFKKILRRK